ncbi:MAG: gliding motility-associated C-terminal domain-containing protein, partial [Bacteroidales bacterium]|nr:gliding motility-associated C-terminal domain-containing protein [Bacteroidales bacterium]
VTPYSRIPGFETEKCAGIPDTVEVWVEPTPKISATPSFDTICNRERINISFTSPTVPTREIRFNYVAIPDHPDSLFVFEGYSGSNLPVSSTINDSLINISNSFQRIIYVFTPVTLDNNNSQKCPGVADTVIVWVEPSARIYATPAQDTICNYDFVNVQFTSPTVATIGVSFNILAIPDNPSSLSGYSNESVYTVDSVLSQQLINSSDTAQRIRYFITPFTLNDKGEQRCPGIETIITVYVEPTAKVVVIPQEDTICNETATYIRLTTVTRPTNKIEFNVEVIPDNPVVVSGNFNEPRLLTTDVIDQTLTNSSDTAQRILYIITPWLVDVLNNQKCPGISDTAIIWLEPTLRFTINPELDTICNETESGIRISTPVAPTHPIRFRYIIRADHIGSLAPFNTDMQWGLFKNDSIIEQFINLTDTAQRVVITITSYSTDNTGNIRCPGIEKHAVVWVEPTPKVTLSPLIDTICTGFSSNIGLSTVSITKHPVRFRYEPIFNIPGVEVYYGQDTFNLAPYDAIIDSIVNNTSVAQRVDFVVYPYLRGANNTEKCPGIIDTAYVWVAPGLIIQVDTISTYKARSPLIPHNIRCFGDLNGSISLMPVGGIMAFPGYGLDDLTYQWSNSATTKDIENLAAGQYHVVINDKLNCLDRDTFTLTQPDKLVATIEIVDTLTCNNNDGTVATEISGGMAGYTPFWSTPMGLFYTDTIYNIRDGTYNLTVTDTNGCVVTAKKPISEPTTVYVYMDPKYYDYRPLDERQYHISCNGESNGKITLWNPSLDFVDITFTGVEIDTTFSGNNLSYVFSNLKAGEYELNYTDINSCTAISSLILNEPDPVKIDDYTLSDFHNRYNISCNGMKDGSITLNTVTGGHYYLPYDFQWQVLEGEGPVAANSRDQSYLSAGVYSVLITDTFGCSLTDTFELTEPDEITISPDIPLAPDGLNNLRCHGDSNGYINLSVSGGDIIENPYTFSWCNGSDTEDLSDLKTGKYSVTVTDGTGCVKSDTFSLTEPTRLKIDSSFVKDYNSYGISCANSMNGAIDIYTSGGMGSHRFEWLVNGNPAAYTTGLLDNLPAGIYNLTVSDTNGCRVYWTDTLVAPAAISLSLIPKNIDCAGEVLGSIKADANGGTGALNYLWNTGSVTDSIYNLQLGTYSITVTDMNLCSVTDSAVIAQDSTLILEVGVNRPVTCYRGDDGILEVKVLRGDPPYTYLWNTGDDTKTLNNARAGTYSVVVTDNNRCKDDISFDLTEPEIIRLQPDIQNVSCFGYSDGEITLTATGGNDNYTYMWQGNTLSGASVKDLAAGTYEVRIYDIKNCYSDTVVTITEPELLDIVIENIKKAYCPDWGDGEISISGRGGTPEYSYSWQGYPDITGPILSGIKPDWYYVTITDANNCTADTSIKMTSNNNYCLDIPTAFTPGNNDRANDYWDVTYVDNYHVSHKFYEIYPNAKVLIYNRWGKLVFTGDINKSFNDGNAIWNGKDNTDKELPVDSYYFMIYLDQDNNSDPIKGTITIIR